MRALHVARALLAASVLLMFGATTASAYTLTTSLRGLGSVEGFGKNQATADLTCASGGGVAPEGTEASPRECSANFAGSTGPGGAQFPAEVRLIATPATGWTVAGFGDPADGKDDVTLLVGAARTVPVRFVNPPPTVSLTTPSSAAPGSIVALDITASDDQAVRSAKIEVRGPGGQLLVSTIQSTVPFSVNWDTTNLVPGDYTVTGEATDNGGTSGTATPRTVRLANPTPTPVATPTPGPAAQPTPTPVASAQPTPTPGSTGPIASGGASTGGSTQSANLRRTNFRYTWASSTTGGKTRFTKLRLKPVTKGAVLSARCTGGGCPKTIPLTSTKGQFEARGLLGRSLSTGAVVELRATKPGLTTLVIQLKVRRGKAPQVIERCVRRPKQAPVRCE